MPQSKRSDGHHGDPLLVNQEGKLIGVVCGATVFDDADSSGRDLLGYPVVKKNDAVGNVFLQAVTRECFFSLLAGDDGCQAFVL